MVSLPCPSLSPDPPYGLLWLMFLLVSILLLSSYYYYVKGAASRHGGRLLPPGSLGLPLGLGENLQFIFGNIGVLGSPRPFLCYRLQKYGTIFKTHLLGFPTVVSMDADLNKLLLSSEEKLVQAAYPDFLRKITSSYIDVHGKLHHQLRDILLSGLGRLAIKNMHFIPFQEHVRKCLHSWSSMAFLDAQQESKKFLYNYTFKFLLNLEPEDPNTLALIKDFEILLKFQTSMPIDVPGTTFNKALKARERIMNRIGELLNAQIEVMGIESNHFMEVIMKNKGKYDSSFNDKSVVHVLYGVVIGSLETTNTLLTNILKHLAENPRVVEELKKEHTFIQMNKKENELLNWDDFKQMIFTKDVIKEALRLTNVTEFVPREALQDIVFKEMVIPKGWRIFINFSMVHLSPTSYENPLKFDPWRWQDAQTTNQPFYMPFGGGTRTCVGSLFVEVQISIFIHYLVTRYRLTLHGRTDNGEQLDVSGHLITKMHKSPSIKVCPL